MQQNMQPSLFVGTGQGFGQSPQQYIVGHIPPVRLKNQTTTNKMDPPPCVQNAMMTKDKKPFTYTPGGIDLSEARSPRLQRRIERNANLGGVGDYAPQQPPHPPITGPLPPSALAAMRPQPQVQVFPSGPPPPAPMRGGVPPPPPPMHGVPPPPPPPSGPLPTQKVCTSDNQVLERPDMTKIIPDNPMALLRKTGGPQPRKSLVDQMFEEAGKGVPEPKSPPYQQPQKQFHPGPPPPQRTQSVLSDRGAPISPVPQQTFKPPQQQYQPQQQVQQQPPAQQRQQPNYREPVKEQPKYQAPVIERQTAIPQQQIAQSDVKTSTAHLGSLYIPPANQQQQNNQKKIVSPPSPPERSLDSPNIQTPPLREAPRPWQAKKPQEEVPAWAKRDNQNSNNVEEVKQKPSPPVTQTQQRWPQSTQNDQATYNPTQPQYQQQPTYIQQPQYRQEQNTQQQPIGVRIEIRTKPQQQQYPGEAEESKPNVVYVTQPLVLQHPGGQGTRIVPVQHEGARTPVGNERVLNRQQSWGNNPSQSNSFKVIQKLTNTDGEDDFDNIPATEHSPKFMQNFQQPVDQMRRMKINDEQNITNTFKQELNVYDEENPRYRGGHIPSKVFKLLDEIVSRDPQPSQNKGPQVRTIPIQIEVACNPPTVQGPVVRNIPIQIEGDDTPRKYVHPSEQVVPEPKKYTGSSIPSRSFKILQAMTAPDNCANADDQNEEFPYDEWVYPPPYPPYPYPPYWYDYYHNYYYPETYHEDITNKKTPPRNGVSRSTSPAVSGGRQTPLPYWGYPVPYYRTEKSNENSRETLKPPSLWTSSSSEKDGNETDESNLPQDYFPYYDPYYYHYYYGYPPMYPGYPYFSSDNDGYSSVEEKSKSMKKIPKIQTPECTPKEKLAPTLNVKETVINSEKIESSECETDTETDDEYTHHLQINPLKSMKSITNINAYSSDDENSKEDNGVEVYSDGSNDDVSSMGYEDDQYPHQLSVIMEESERAESRLRSVSVLSDSTTLAEKSDAEEESYIEHNSNNNNKNEELPADIKDTSPTNSEAEVTNKICSENEINDNDDDDDKKSDESEDWWGILGKDEDDYIPPRKIVVSVEEYQSSDNQVEHEEINKENDTDEEQSLHQNETSSNSSDEEEDNDKTIDNNINEEENTTTLTPEITTKEPVEYTVVLRRKKPEPTETKPRPRSIYDSLEDIKTESTGSLVKVDNFVDILEQIQKDFGCFLNSQSRKDEQKLDKPRNCRPVSMYEMTELEDKPIETKEKRFSYSSFEEFTSTQDTTNEETIHSSDDDNNTLNCSTNYTKYNSSKSSKPVLKEPTDESLEETDTSSSEKDDKETFVQLTNDDVKVPSIQDRIQALRRSINTKRTKLLSESDAKSSNNRSKPTSSKSSLKSFEESEEEEVDSGVTSDMSRHISDTEEFPELRKLTKYQRAATHSRLFKLLQDECNNEDDDSDKLNVENKGSVNERLVNELIDSLLKLKKGQAFKNLPKEKLYAAAVKILQEDMEIDASTEDYGSLSPITGDSTAVQTPQEFVGNTSDEYKQYYESWDRNDDNYTSKGLKGKSIRSFSSKNIHKKLIKLLETSENPNFIPQKPSLETNDVTSVS